MLFTERYTGADRLPRYVALDERLAAGDRVLLNLRYWNHPELEPLPGVRVAQRARFVDVDRSGPQPRARLDLDLSGVGPDEEVTVQAVGFPADEPAQRVARLRVPAQAVVEFGVGVREECWGDDAATTRFSLKLHRGAETPLTLFERAVDPRQPADRRWFDARIDLSRWADDEVALSFETESGPGCALPAWSDPVLYATPRTDERVNAVLVSIDTLRARSLGAYGYGRDTSPFLDSVAERGALFEQVMTTSVTTAPSHMSLFTGLYPVRHGIRRGNEIRRREAPTLAESFRAAGYRTAAFTENGYLLRARGFGDGFSRYVENRGEGTPTGEPTDARVTFAQARAWLDAEPREPFFLFVHTYEVHTPYRAREPHAQRFEGDGFPGPEQPLMRTERDNYDREIRVVDDELRALFAALEARGLAGRTLVAIAADHGEEFHEHGGYQHGGDLFEEALHVPLILWGPDVPKGRRVRGEVSLIDVAPTLLELTGLPVPAGLDGESLAGALRGGEVAPRTLYAEAMSPRRWVDVWQFETWHPPLFAVRRGDSKFLVHRPQRGEKQPTVRYDLANDPLERDPLPLDADKLAEVDDWVDAYLRTEPGPAAQTEITPDERDHLRALGYGD